MLAHPPLAIPRGTRLRGPAGSLRCSIYRGATKLVAALLRHPVALFPDKSALLARVNGTGFRAHSTVQVFVNLPGVKPFCATPESRDGCMPFPMGLIPVRPGPEHRLSCPSVCN